MTSLSDKRRALDAVMRAYDAISEVPPSEIGHRGIQKIMDALEDENSRLTREVHDIEEAFIATTR